MIQQKKVLTRQQLYDLVWAKPMIHLAKEFQLSDNGLRKICKKYEIPIPEGGYWNKLKFGKSTKQRVLPPSKDNDSVEINIVAAKEKAEPSKKFGDIITVPERIAKSHPLIVQTKQRFSVGYKYENGTLVESLDFRISLGQLSRACRIVDTLIKTLEMRGAQVIIDREGNWKQSTCVKIEGEKVHFYLKESQKVLKKEPNPKSLYSTRELIPTGKLGLYITDYMDGHRTQWTDSDKTKLDENLTPFINGLWVAAALLKKRRQQREQENHRREAEQKEYERQLQAREEEKSRIQNFENLATSWQKSRLLRAYIRALLKRQGAYSPESQFAKWVTWATDYADRTDPLKTITFPLP